MKQLLIFLFLIASSVTASAQFPLGSNVKKIKAYFDANIQYINAQEFKAADGKNAICFRKMREVGDYVFYFDNNGNCCTYTVTYDKNEITNLTERFDSKFIRIYYTRWADPDNTFDVTLVPPKPGENYFSIVYRPLNPGIVSNVNTIASN